MANAKFSSTHLALSSLNICRVALIQLKFVKYLAYVHNLVVNFFINFFWNSNPDSNCLKIKKKVPALKVELKADPPLCTLCEFVVTYADNLLKNNQTEQQIVKSLELVCNLAPGSLKTQCTALVDQFGPTIVELLIKYGNDSKKICQEIKICPAEQLKQQVKADPPLCTLCQFVVQYADTLLKNNASEAQIVKAMGKS